MVEIYKVCIVCKGNKKITGLGMLLQDCTFCKATGKIKCGTLQTDEHTVKYAVGKHPNTLKNLKIKKKED
jgi:hypothetical protein